MRREGKTPASVYGRGIKSIPIQVETKKLEQILIKAGGTDLISLSVEGSTVPVNVLVREVQKEPLSDTLLHVDFYQVDMLQKIKAGIPLHFTGEAPVLKMKNTSIIHLMDELNVEALPDHLPHRIEIDLTVLLEVDQSIHVKDIQLSSDVTILSDPEQVVAKAIEAKVEAEVVEAPKAEVTGEEVAAAEGTEEEQKPEAKARARAKE